jgi:hypothetical protein
VDRAEQARLNVPADVTEKTVTSYRVPEGATVLMCARWFPAGDAPTWESDQASYQASAIVQTADRYLPSLEFTGFTPRDDRTVELEVRVATPEGTQCGRLDADSVELELPRVLCRADRLDTGGAEATGSPGAERLADRGFDGSLVLRVDAVLSSGETSETTYLLPAGAGSCAGTCAPPDDAEFAVATIGGTMHVTQSWVPGLQNGGVEDWRISAETENPIDYVAPDAPQLDRGSEWQFTEPGFRPDVVASMQVRADRPVDWEFTTYSPTADAARSCGPSPVPVAQSGRADDGMIRIALPAVCVGGTYLGILTLRDDDGDTSVYSAPGTGAVSAGWWPAGVMEVPQLDVTLRYRVDVFDASRAYVQQLSLVLDGAERPLADDYASPPGSRCNTDGIIKSEGRFDTSLRAAFALGLSVLIVPQRSTSDGSCAGTLAGERAEPMLTTVQLAQLASPDGLLIESGDTVLHVWAQRR